MLDLHQKLAATLADAAKQAVAIEQGGGAVQTVIHNIRSAATLVDLRIKSYQEQAAADAAPKKLSKKEQAAAKAAAEREEYKNLLRGEWAGHTVEELEQLKAEAKATLEKAAEDTTATATVEVCDELIAAKTPPQS